MDNDMLERWNEVTLSTFINNEKKKKVIQEIMHDDLSNDEEVLKEGE